MTETKFVTGRTSYPWTKKICPWWWLWNDLEPVPDNWYMPGEPSWKRQLYWWFRNPCANFVGFVIGVNDRNYSITGTAPVEHGSLRDVGLTGFKWSYLSLGWMRLPFISYAGKHWELYCGWRYSGGFGVKIIRHA